jgi:hypothetical protein
MISARRRVSSGPSPVARITATISSTVGGSAGKRSPLFFGGRAPVIAGHRRRRAAMTGGVQQRLLYLRHHSPPMRELWIDRSALPACHLKPLALSPLVPLRSAPWLVPPRPRRGLTLTTKPNDLTHPRFTFRPQPAPARRALQVRHRKGSWLRRRRTTVARRRQSRWLTHRGDRPACRQSRASPRRRPVGQPGRPLGRPAFFRRRVRAAACGPTEPRPRFRAARRLSAQIGPALLVATSRSGGARRGAPARARTQGPWSPPAAVPAAPDCHLLTNLNGCRPGPLHRCSVRRSNGHANRRAGRPFRVQAHVSPVIDCAAAQQPEGPSGRG